MNATILLLPHLTFHASASLHGISHLTHKMANGSSSSEALTMAPLTFGLGFSLIRFRLDVVM